MNHSLWHENKEPLCYGYFIDDMIGFKVDFDYAGSLCFENPIGKNLIDFAWIDESLIRSAFNQTFSVYISLCSKSNDHDYLADGLLRFVEQSLMHINCYFTVCLLGFIEFLLAGRADKRLLSNIAVDTFAMDGYFVFVDSGELPASEKKHFMDVFVQSIMERQTLVEQTLSKVLGGDSSASQDALSRFYEYECQDDLFREHWHSRFEVSFGVRSNNQEEVLQLAALQRIDDMLRYELVQMLVRDVQYKRCQSCGKLFIPSGRADSLYCGRIMPGQEKPCNQIGASLVAKKKMEGNPALKLYRQGYHRLSKRVEFGYMESEAFDKWKAQALPKREQCLRGDLSLDEFTLWINNTSRQRLENQR